MERSIGYCLWNTITNAPERTMTGGYKYYKSFAIAARYADRLNYPRHLKNPNPPWCTVKEVFING